MSYWTKRRKINTSVAKQIATLNENHYDSERDGIQEFPPDILNPLPACAMDVIASDAVDCEGTDTDSLVVSSRPGISNEWLDDEIEDGNESDDNCPISSDSVDIVDQLRRWAAAASIKQDALTELLEILRPHIPELPKDARTLLNTPTTLDLLPHMQKVSGGLYYHFGISDGIVHRLQNNGSAGTIDTLSLLSLQVNIDGVPVFKSTNGQFWPILGKLDIPSFDDPFVIGLFYGETKPKDLHFLDDFVNEYQSIKENGIFFNGSTVQCKISALVCDAPARSFIKNVKGHTSYSSCERCVQSGVWNGKMTFPEVNAQKRTDVSFDELSDVDHHRGPSPMASLGIGMVSQFVLDYMHLICLGVTQRLISLWLTGPVSGIFRLRARTVSEICDSLVSLRNFMPYEFARKPRSLLEWQRWKATEFRQFLLYTGPVALLGKLPHVVYNNFMLLYVGVFILLDIHLSSSSVHVDYAEELLVMFVKHYSDLYGSDMVVFNIHNVIHLADDCRKYGSLDNISAFCFENYLGKLTKLVRKPNKPLEQVVRRILEQRQISVENRTKPVCEFVVSRNDEHHNGFMPSGVSCSYKQYKRITVNKICISIHLGNNCLVLNDNIVLVRNILVKDNEAVLMYQKFSKCSSFFTYPLESTVLEIYQVSDLTNEMFAEKLSEIHIKRKNVILPHNGLHVVFPLLHL